MADIWSLEQQKRALEHKNRELNEEKKEIESMVSDLSSLVADHLDSWKRNQDAFADKAGINGEARCVDSFMRKMDTALNSGATHSISSKLSSLCSSMKIELQRIQYKIDENEYQIRICNNRIRAEKNSLKP